MNWRAAHESPERWLARSEHPDWACARRWLIESMLLALPLGCEEALHALARAPPNVGCLFQEAGHSFAIVSVLTHEREVVLYA